MTKQCSRCREIKDLDEFYNEKKKPDGKAYYCKECSKFVRSEYHKNNRDQENTRSTNYCKINRAKVTEQQMRYNKTEKGKEVVSKSNKNHYIKIKNSYPALHRTNQLRAIISTRLSPKTKWHYNFDRKIKELSYTYQQLREKLESQFTSEMNWQNYGDIWEIDHIKPVCSFKLADKKQFDECWSLDNIRPLLKEDNKEKRKQDIGMKYENLQNVSPEKTTRPIL